MSALELNSGRRAHCEPRVRTQGSRLVQDKLTKLARGRPCMVRLSGICNFDPETTVLAHYRMIGISGMGIKCPSIIAAWACSTCHGYVDTHHDEPTQLAFAQGCFRTQAQLVREGKLKW